MPMRNPNSAATAMPMTMASGKRIAVGSEFSVRIENRELEKAPTHMKPACPRESSPRIPTQMFRPTATIA